MTKPQIVHEDGSKHVDTPARKDRCAQCQSDLADSLLKALNSDIKPRVIVVPHPDDSK